MARWKALDCPSCGGRGVVSAYTFGGTDFLGPGECPHCNSGVIFVSEGDRVADFPGGPFRGRWPGAFEEAERSGVPDWTLHE